MRMHKLTALLVGAAATLAVASASAQTPPPDQSPQTQARSAASKSAAKKKPTQVAMVSRPAARVVVRRRSFLDPGTATKTHDEHYQDYAFPPGGNIIGADPTDFRINFNHSSPFPSSCFDLPGFCR